MRVVFDIRAVQSRHHGERGIARYVNSLGAALEEIEPGLVTDYLIDPAFPLPPAAEWAIRTGRCRGRDDVPSWLRAERGVFLIGSPFEESNDPEGVLPRWAQTPSWQVASILYDLIPLRFPEHYLADPGFRTHYLTRLPLLRRADRLLAISEASREDAVELLGVHPNRIDVIWAGADRRYDTPDDDRGVIASRLADTGGTVGLRPGYVLFTGGPDWRKNIHGLLAAYALLPTAARQEHQLVVVCKLDQATLGDLRSRTAELGIADDVLFTGFVEDRTLVALTQGAELVVFPSHYEGFGLPVLEARRCGTPVLCGDNSSLVEVLPDPSARFDAGDPKAIADAMQRVLDDEGERARLVSQPIDDRFTWETAAATTAASVRSMAHRLRVDAGMHVRDHRVAVVTSTETPPPTYVIELVEALGERAEVTVAHEALDARGRARVVTPDELRAEIEYRRPSDLVLHILGTAHDAPTLLDHDCGSGHAVLLLSADLRRAHGIGVADVDGDAVAATVEGAYPGRYVRTATGAPNLDPEHTIRSGMLLTQRIRNAETVYCLDRYTAELAALDAGVRAVVLPPWLVGKVVQAPPPPPSRRDIVWCDSDLAPLDDDIAVQALAMLCHEGEPVQMHLVHAREERRRALRLAARQLGVEGALSDGPPDPQVRDAAVLLHVPSRTFGGVPEPVVHAIRAGLRVVLADVGALSEIVAPDVAHVRTHVGARELAAALRTSLRSDPSDVVHESIAVGIAADRVLSALIRPGPVPAH